MVTYTGLLGLGAGAGTDLPWGERLEGAGQILLNLVLIDSFEELI